MSQEEKDAFVDLVDLAFDYNLLNDFTDDEIKLYHAIIQEKYDKVQNYK